MRWDEAEEAGGLLVRFVSNFKREWRAAGAVAFRAAPEKWCPKCREASGGSSWWYEAIAVVPRGR